MADVSITNPRVSGWHKLRLILVLLGGCSDVKVRLIQLRVGPSWRGEVSVGGKESAEISVQDFRENMYVILERNYGFLNLKHRIHSVLGIQVTNSDYTFCRSPKRYPPQCPPSDVPTDLPRSTQGSKVGVKIQVKIEDVLLWSVVHAIRIGTEPVLWLFIGFR